MSSYTGTRCSRCGRPLKNPKWVDIGMGKICYGKYQIEKARMDAEHERDLEKQREEISKRGETMVKKVEVAFNQDPKPTVDDRGMIVRQ